MLEGVVSNLLNRVLGMYVKNFDPKHLSVGIWSGDVKLTNLELRKEALDQLHLPLNVVEGHLGSLTMSIPWSNLRGKPVKINIEDVFILAAPREDADYNEEEETNREFSLKMEKLESAELLKERNTEGMSKEDQAKQQSFTASMTTAIIDNLQVTIKNIHVRYEDSISDPGHPFAAGLTLRDFSAISTDGNWKPTFIQGQADSTHKLAKLDALAIYWDTDTKLLGIGKGSEPGAEAQGINHDELLATFKKMIVQEESDTSSNHQYILKPVTGSMGIEMDKTGKTDRAQIKARVFFDELGFLIDDEQYRDALMLVDLFHYFIRHNEYKKFQPKKTPKEDPRAWLQFAGKAVLDRIHDRNRRWSWDYFKERRDDRKRYVELFKKKKKEEKLAKAETDALEALEKKLTYEDLRFWRSLARNELRKENVGIKKAPQKQTWSSWVWNGGKNPDAAKTEPTSGSADDNAQLSEQQRKELYDAIAFDEKKALAEAVELPPESIKLQVHVALKTGSFSLKRDPHGKGLEILQLLFDNFNTSFIQRPESMLAKLSLHGMHLHDGTTEGTLYPEIINVKGSSSFHDHDRVTELNDDADDQQPDAIAEKAPSLDMTAEKFLDAKDEELQNTFEDKFFSLAFEQNPLDGHADSALSVKLKAMEIVSNAKFLEEVAKFFKPPERHMESIGALMETAGATVEGLRQSTRAGLEFALVEHKTIDVHLDLQAPLIIVPDSVTQNSSICLILDAGHISVNSELIDKDTIQEMQNKQKQKLDDEAFKRLENLMYDRFSVKLESTQLLVGPSIEETRAQLQSNGENARDLHLIDQINMHFTIETCILPTDTTLTKFRITGNLPVLHASISDSKYKSMMRLLEVAIPNFSDESSPSKDPAPIAQRPDPPARSSSRRLSRPATELQETMKPRSKSFQFSAQESELILEEDEEEMKDAEFKDATTGHQAPEVNLSQKNFEFKFVVDKLQGSLYRSDPEGKNGEKLLAELVAESFCLDFYQRAFDMVAEVSLRALTLEDHVEQAPIPEFKNIIYSEDTSSEPESKGLLQIMFQKVNPESPEFQTVHGGVSTNLDVDISTINLVVTRRTLLTLLDFVLATFTDSAGVNQEALPASETADDESAIATEAAPSEDRIRIKAELKTISVIFNDDGIRLATLSLNTASVALMLMGNTMRVAARLGNLSLVDDVNQGVSEQSSLRQLVTIEGKELADFSYETFDPESETYPGHDSTVFLRAGSLKVNFVNEPFRKIMEFAVKFGKMQAVFNAAREAAANQATNIQQRATRMQFDVLVSTPIIVFPRAVSIEGLGRDSLTAYLGEIYAKNKFVPIDDSKEADTANKLSAGLRNVRLESKVHYHEQEDEVLELIDKVDIDFDVTNVEHKPGQKRPDLEVRGKMSDVNVKVTPPQLKFLLELSQAIPAAFATEPEAALDQAVEEELPDSTTKPAKQISQAKDVPQPATNVPAHQMPELETSAEHWTKTDLVFKAGAIGLELSEAKDDKPMGDAVAATLAKFSINDTNIKLRMVSDGSMEAELLIQSFTVTDTRKRGTNKFRKIMSLTNTDITQQFMATVTMSGGDEKNLLAIVSVDSPKVIVSLEFAFAVQAFVNAGLAVETNDDSESEEEDAKSQIEMNEHTDDEADQQVSATRKQDNSQEQSEVSMNMSFRVNLVDAQVIVIANPALASSEAIVLSLKQAVVAKQHATTVQAEKIGLYLCRMDRFDSNHLRILDDFSIATSLDIREQGQESTMTNISIDIEPLVLRLSLRDILLVMQIFQRASEMSRSIDQDSDLADQEAKKLPGVKTVANRPPNQKRASSTGKKTAKSIKTRRASVAPPTEPQQNGGSVIMKREELDLHMGGIRVVLIGDTHELPMFDWSVNQFDVTVRDWSGAMTADSSVDTFINVYNFAKSAWEPLIEPWTLALHMAKDLSPPRLSIDLFSRKQLDLTVTTATIALASKSFDFLSTEEDVLSKPRGNDAPYRIRNQTGFVMNIWAQRDDGREGSAARIEDGDEAPWRFEDATIMRETLSTEASQGIVAVRLDGTGFDSIERIPINKEGEVLYNLMPRKDKVLHRLLVDVELGADSVKHVTFKSPLTVENASQIPIEIGIYSPEEGHLLRIEKIPPGSSRPSPIGACFLHSVVVRPDPGFGYTWSNERLFWKDITKRPTQVITCKGDENDPSAPPFYFQMNAIYDKTNPITNIYPFMKIRLSPPVELQNLLPFDFKYRIYDKNTKKDWTNFLRKGGVSPVHVVNLTHLLLLSVDVQDTPFKQSEYAVINSPSRDFSREKTVVIKDTAGLTLRLKLHYYNVPDSGGAFKVTIYSPYIVLNRTGLDLELRSKGFLSGPRAAAGQGVITEDSSKAIPFMFSFPTDDQSNRASIKVGDSQWSKPQSFDAIGSTYDVSVPAAGGRSEMQLGVTVSQGEGKYKLTNVVTVSPRFVVKNKIGEDINLREPGSNEVVTLKADDLHPIRFLKQLAGQQLCLQFPGLNNQWSSPFTICNVGRVHVKIAKEKKRQQLVQAEIFLENATIFIFLSISKHWPFSVRNESDTEFLFYQANPNISEDEEDRGSGWRPIRYRVPARSVMPYAWDYPASRNKDLILTARGKDRTVKLAEIGPQIPLKLPAADGESRQKIVSIEVSADGPRQALVLTNYKASQSMYKQKSGPKSSAQGFEVKDQDFDVTFKAQVRLAGIGISLVNKNLRELLYATFREIELKFNESALYQTVNFTTKWIQIDNQLYGGIFPILLYPSVVPKTGKEMEAHPIFHTALTRVKDDTYGVLYIKYFTVLLQQMTIEMDEDFIFALLDFAKIPGASWAEQKEGKLCEEELTIPEPQQESQGQDIYFELLHLQPMQIDLSFVRTERVNVEDTLASNNPLNFAVNVLTMSIGNVNDAPLRYNALMIENARITLNALLGNIQNHYVQESLRQVHVIIGSADFLGNPVGLFNNVSSGVADIFYEPYQGLVNTDRPQDLGFAFAKGASSFVKKSVFGFSDSMAKFTGSMSKGLAAASMDKEFQDQRRMSKARNRPKHALYGISAGGNAFANSLASGIGGLARHPIEGAEKEGALGFVKGVGKGFLGLPTKAAVGFFDAASSMAEGVRNTTTVFDQEALDRVRLTRFIGMDGVVRPYSQREALGQFWLKTIDNGKYFNENYIAHLDLQSQGGGGSKDLTVMLTYNDIVLVRTQKLTSEWDVPLKDVQRISKERTGMNITLKEGRQGPFVPVGDEGQRNWLYKQIAVAVTAFNERWQARA